MRLQNGLWSQIYSLICFVFPLGSQDKTNHGINTSIPTILKTVTSFCRGQNLFFFFRQLKALCPRIQCKIVLVLTFCQESMRDLTILWLLENKAAYSVMYAPSTGGRDCGVEPKETNLPKSTVPIIYSRFARAYAQSAYKLM